MRGGMPTVHEYVGFFVVGVFALGWIWGLGAWALKRTPGAAYWGWLTVAQVVAVLQALLGIGLFIAGYRRELLHYAYGIFPIVALVIAHSVARRPDYAAKPWLPFAIASFFCFGLALRALMTGLGTG
jgi:hypothetical protein